MIGQRPAQATLLKYNLSSPGLQGRCDQARAAMSKLKACILHA